MPQPSLAARLLVGVHEGTKSCMLTAYSISDAWLRELLCFAAVPPTCTGRQWFSKDPRLSHRWTSPARVRHPALAAAAGSHTLASELSFSCLLACLLHFSICACHPLSRFLALSLSFARAGEFALACMLALVNAPSWATVVLGAYYGCHKRDRPFADVTDMLLCRF